MVLFHECGFLLVGTPQRLVRDKISGSAAPGLPFNGAAADVRAAILAVLASWSGLVAQERNTKAPKRTIGALTHFLTIHADWLAGRAVAPDVTSEVRALVRRARSVVDPHRIRRITVGSCTELDCSGNLVAVVHLQEALLPPEISCDMDSAHRWPAHTWTLLSKQIGQRAADAVRWLSAADVARLWRTSPGSVYRLASERGWRRLKEAGRTYYHEADVAETFRDRG